MKRFISYLLYTLFVGVIMYWGMKYAEYVKIQAGRTYSLYPKLLFMALYPIIIGIILAMPGLIQRIRKEGEWRIDWQMLLPIGLPTLLYNIYPLVSLSSNNPFLFKYDWYKLMLTDIRSYDISGIVFGYGWINDKCMFIKVIRINDSYQMADWGTSSVRESLNRVRFLD